MESFWQDLRYGFRTLVKNPAFTLVVMITLGLGIGANTVIFSVMKAVLLTPLPYAQPDQVVMIWNRWTGWEKAWLSVPEYLDYRELCTTLSSTGAWEEAEVNLTGGSEPERVSAARLTPSVFEVLGVDPLLGHAFREEEGLPGQDQVVVLGYGLWRRRFAADPNVIGTNIEVDGRLRTVIGIMTASFQLPLDFEAQRLTELYIPLAIDPAAVDRTRRGSHGLHSVARLAPGATPDQATAELYSLSTQFRLYPPEMHFESFASALQEEIVGEVRPALLLLQAAVGFLLLIACANVANLWLARAERRQQEIAIRNAVGANRPRIVRQLLTESLVLSLGGAGLGVLLADAGSSVLLAWDPHSIPRVNEVEMDTSVLAFTLLVSLATTFLFGLAPALHSSKLDLVASLKEGGRALATGSQGRYVRDLLVVVQITIAVVLVIASTLMIRSLWGLLNVDTGFDPDNVLTVRLSVPESGYPENQDTVSFYQELLDRVA
ncbi:ABC transporter permease, partial [Acidobacteria bacterium AH-259-A15]|nr:ABC transporter permease [Acidobacteria bacterium AH-259-A15]